MPKHILLTLEVFVIWIPLLFHSVYGIFITNRAQPNFFTTKYKWSQNRMYTLQRYSGIAIFFFLAYHVATTTVLKYITNDAKPIMYEGWHAKLTSFYGLFLLIYLVGILASAYHLAYGIWNFSIRWGIVITERAQHRIQKISAGLFVALVVLGYGALAGFLIPRSAQRGNVLPNSSPNAPIQTQARR